LDAVALHGHLVEDDDRNIDMVANIFEETEYRIFRRCRAKHAGEQPGCRKADAVRAHLVGEYR
jgi:hypothetical protein